MLEPAMRGTRFRRVIVNRPNLRIDFPERFVERLRGRTAEDITRRGKYLLIALSSGETLIMHLGMSGWVHVSPIGDRTREVDPHDHVVFDDGAGYVSWCSTIRGASDSWTSCPRPGSSKTILP